MDTRKKITQYRERLDKTLASPDLTTEETLKAHVKNQLLRYSEHETEGCNEQVFERRTAEVSNFLDMLRSASSGNNDGRKAPEMVHPEWKIKHDDEEFRVMYCEGPKGTPFHTLLVEGFVDGPVDVCLCISWESALYKKWWPQTSVPTFKILSSKCLQKLRIGEQISLVRVKVSWPLSTREVIVHYFVFEYFKDDLIVVVLNSISDSDNIDITTHGFSYKAIPEAEDVVRIDVVGGFALQKVTENRSYFRTIANMDMKLDFIPPSLINFISRQLIGNGFRLYQKVVSSTCKSDDDFSKALKDPLYTRINEALYQRNEHDKVQEEEEPSQEMDQIVHHFREERQENSTEDQKVCDIINQTNEPVQTVMQIKETKACGEIEEEDSTESRHFEEDGKDNDISLVNGIEERCHFKGHRIHIISPEVEKALETLDDIINVVRKCGFNAEAKTASCLTDKQLPDLEKGIETNLSTSENSKIRSRVEFSISMLKQEIVERVADELPRTSSTHSFRGTRSNSLSKEVNHNKVVPASPEQKLSPAGPDEVDQVTPSEPGTVENPISDQNSSDHYHPLIDERNAIDEISQDAGKRSARNKKNRYWCFPGSPIRLKGGRRS